MTSHNGRRGVVKYCGYIILGLLKMVRFWGNLVCSVKVLSEFFGCCGWIRWVLGGLKDFHDFLVPPYIWCVSSKLVG